MSMSADIKYIKSCQIYKWEIHFAGYYHALYNDPIANFIYITIVVIVTITIIVSITTTIITIIIGIDAIIKTNTFSFPTGL